MKIVLLIVALVSPSFAVSIPTLAGIFSIAASSGQIIREGHDMIKHPVKTTKHHVQQIKDAVKGKK